MNGLDAQFWNQATANNRLVEGIFEHLGDQLINVD